MIEKRLKPTFIGIGFQRCGTSWLNRVLYEHPEIGKPASGLHFFTQYYDRGNSWYERELASFDPGTGIVGEFSTPYCYPEAANKVAARIQAAYQNVKLIFSVREPVSRCRSDYRRLMRRGEIPETDLSFANAINKYPEILARSHYAPVLELFYQRFPAENIFVIRYDDIESDPDTVVQTLYAFLGVDTGFRPDSLTQRLGASYAMKSPIIERAVQRMQYAGRSSLSFAPNIVRNGIRNIGRRAVDVIRNSNTNKLGEVIPESTIRQQEKYDDDLNRVMEMTGLDLHKWVSR